MLDSIVFILVIAFGLYTILGGADFGGGIIETFAGTKRAHSISKAMAPVWEANHVWLILAVVILFNAFPKIYSTLSVVLHIPLMVILIGIILRGSAFTFRHYDTDEDLFHPLHTKLFIISSWITSLFLGITLGAMILGKIDLQQGLSFREKFIDPWLNVFCFATGLFTCSLFSYIAAVFLVHESAEYTERRKFILHARLSMLTCFVTGLLVFLTASMEGLSLFSEMIKSTPALFLLIFATISAPVIWYFLNRGTSTPFYLRLVTGAQIAAILSAWFFIQYPVVIAMKSGEHLTILNAHAPEITLKYLLIALVVGLLLIVPGFVFLYRVFK